MKTTAWRDLGIRIVSAAILAPLALLALSFGGWPWKMWLLVGLIGMCAEWAKLAKIDVKATLFLAIPFALVTPAATAVAPRDGIILVFIIAAVGALVARRLILGLGVLYIWPAFVSLLVLRTGPNGFRNVLFLVLVVWGTDIGAYLVGRLVGGPRLAPKISPGKTWSGTFGGLAAAALVGAASGHERAAVAAALAIGLSVIAQAGDLLESAIKRHFGVKDTSRLIPGHGGLMDRLDGFIAAAILAFLIGLARGLPSVAGGLFYWA